MAITPPLGPERDALKAAFAAAELSFGMQKKDRMGKWKLSSAASLRRFSYPRGFNSRLLFPPHLELGFIPICMRHTQDGYAL
jgi:hypothetical protein